MYIQYTSPIQIIRNFQTLLFLVGDKRCNKFRKFIEYTSLSIRYQVNFDHESNKMSHYIKVHSLVSTLTVI